MWTSSADSITGCNDQRLRAQDVQQAPSFGRRADVVRRFADVAARATPACRRTKAGRGQQPYAPVVDATWPRPLVSGEPCSALSPAGPPDLDRVARGIELLEGWGLHVSQEPGERDGFLAAPDHDRKRSVQRAFDDPEVRAVLCTRGGYGSQRIVDDLNVDGFVARRAAFVGSAIRQPYTPS